MSRVVVVSNRLPVTVDADRQPPDDVMQSSGGLASALRSLADDFQAEGKDVIWIGWPGSFVEPSEQERMTQRLKEESTNIKLVPVWLSQGDVDNFYSGFSNSSLWPLLHWMTPYARFKRAWSDAYRRVNEQYADTILSVATPQDLIWIHDYHLFLVPKLLRNKRDDRVMQDELQKHGLVKGQELSSCNLQSLKRPQSLPRTDEDEEDETEAVSPEGRGGYPETTLSFHSAKEEGEESQATAVIQSEASKALTQQLDQISNEESSGFVRVSGAMPARQKLHQVLRRSVTEVELQNKLKIAFFLHTPFPSYEVLCALPQCVDIVEGLLGADLVGFHTHNYLRHFRSSVIRLCGFTPEIDHVDHRGQRTRLGVFPIGANVQSFLEAMKTEKFREHLKEYTEQFQGKSLVLNVERLDYSKGISKKLAAIQRYLEDAKAQKTDESEEAEKRSDRLEDLQNRFSRLDKRKANRGLTTSNLRRIGASVMGMLSQAFGDKEQKDKELDHNKTVFVFIAVPSRRDVEEYQDLEEQVHKTISEINGEFSTVSHQPIVYIHRSVPMPELAALYARADCCLVTPLIDGMNLVAKEFIACKDPNIDNVVPGTVVLSELAGAAQELFDAIVVNPYDEEAVADAIAVGLELTRGNRLAEDQRWEVTDRMREAVMENDAVRWAYAVLEALDKPREGDPIARPASMQMQLLRDSVASRFFECIPGTKALFLDYDGTLREFESTPAAAVPSEEAHSIFRKLGERSDLKVYIVSGRNREFLEQHFGGYSSFTLIAEHGYFKRGPDTKGKWAPFTLYTATDWMDKIRPVMEMFTKCTPGAHIEEKASAIVWHYRDCDEEYGQFKAKELMHQLALSLGNLPCQISQGQKIVEVASLQVKKGNVVTNAIQQQTHLHGPFVEILICGDDRTDESMFLDAPPTAWTVKVGKGETAARYRLLDPANVRRFLGIIVDQNMPLTPHASSKDGNRPKVAFHSGTSPQRDDDDTDPLAGFPETEEGSQQLLSS